MLFQASWRACSGHADLATGACHDSRNCNVSSCQSSGHHYQTELGCVATWRNLQKLQVDPTYQELERSMQYFLVKHECWQGSLGKQEDRSWARTSLK